MTAGRLASKRRAIGVHCTVWSFGRRSFNHGAVVVVVVLLSRGPKTSTGLSRLGCASAVGREPNPEPVAGQSRPVIRRATPAPAAVLCTPAYSVGPCDWRGEGCLGREFSLRGRPGASRRPGLRNTRSNPDRPLHLSGTCRRLGAIVARCRRPQILPSHLPLPLVTGRCFCFCLCHCRCHCLLCPCSLLRGHLVMDVHADLPTPEAEPYSIE